jgi:hypothetical protein
MDKDTGFVCITDIGNVKEEGGGQEYVRNWLRNANSIAFFIAWEKRHNPGFKPVEFDRFKNEAGLNSFRISASDLVEAGATGIFTKRGRYGGTYCNIDWTIHFANWLDAAFYVETIDAFRNLSDTFYGPQQLHQRFARGLASENFGLVTGGLEANLPSKADLMVRRHLSSVEADILNLAMWGMTAQRWRIKFKQPDPNVNMRDFATTEELKTLAALEISMRNLQEDQYSEEEKLDRLQLQAPRLLLHYCNTPEKVLHLTQRREERGW